MPVTSGASSVSYAQRPRSQKAAQIGLLGLFQSDLKLNCLTLDIFILAFVTLNVGLYCLAQWLP